MRVKSLTHKNQMGKKKITNASTSWVPSEFEQSDLTKAHDNGFLAEGGQVIFPSTERIPKPPSGYRGDVSCLSFVQLVLSCPRISSWASLHLRRAASPAHAKFYFAHRLFRYSL
jgi:hypothetical protein